MTIYVGYAPGSGPAVILETKGLHRVRPDALQCADGGDDGVRLSIDRFGRREFVGGLAALGIAASRPDRAQAEPPPEKKELKT